MVSMAEQMHHVQRLNKLMEHAALQMDRVITLHHHLDYVQLVIQPLSLVQDHLIGIVMALMAVQMHHAPLT